MNRSVFLVLATLFPLLCSMLWVTGSRDIVWQPGPKPGLLGMIYGTVFNKMTGAPLKDAVVKLTSGGPAIQTDSQGHYVLSNVAPGTLTVKASLSGFRRKLKTVQVLSNESVVVNFHLRPKSNVANQNPH